MPDSVTRPLQHPAASVPEEAAGAAARSVTAPSEAVGSAPNRRGIFSLRFVERYLLVGIWILVAAFFGVTKSASFLQFATAQTIFGNYSIYVFLGLAALCTTVIAEIDLSVAFIMGLAATLVPLLVTDGVNVLLASLIALAVSALCGAFNAWIIVRLRVNALIATLGLGTVLLGISEVLTHEQSVSGVPTSFQNIAVTNVLGLSISFWYGIVLAGVMAFVLSFTPLGRHVAFVGSNREVARLAGIRVNRIRFGAYICGGLIAGLAGVLLSAQLGGFDPSSSQAYLLPTFAIVFLSAAVVRPGRFNPIGVVIAAYFISTAILGLELMGYSGPQEQIFYGGALVAAISAVTVVQRRSASV
jgi:ribose transport system permease protein